MVGTIQSQSIMRNCILIVSVIFLIVLCGIPAFAFDGERSGFVIGGGLGFGPVAQNEIKGLRSSSITSSGIAVNGFTGYGYDDNTIFVVLLDGIITKTETAVSDKKTVFQGFTGIGVMYYFGEAGESFYMTSGIGVQRFHYFNGSEINHTSEFAYLIGAGYEFTEHVQGNFSFSTGETKTTFKWRETQLSLTLTFVGY